MNKRIKAVENTKRRCAGEAMHGLTIYEMRRMVGHQVYVVSAAFSRAEMEYRRYVARGLWAARREMRDFIRRQGHSDGR